VTPGRARRNCQQVSPVRAKYWINKPAAWPPLSTERAAPGRHLEKVQFECRVYEALFRVNVRWVTPLGDETASTS
jgi:hypothetical protein